MCFAGLGIGAAVGAVNGFFIAYVRLQPVVVTLAVMFIIPGSQPAADAGPGGLHPLRPLDGLHRRSHPRWLPRSTSGHPAGVGFLGAHQALALRHRALRRRQQRGRRLRQRHLGRADQVLRLHAGRHLLRRGRGLPQRADQLRRSAGGQRHAAPHLVAATILGGTRIGGGEGRLPRHRVRGVHADADLERADRAQLVAPRHADHGSRDPAAGGDRRLHRPRHVLGRVLAGDRPQDIGAQAPQPALLPRQRAGERGQARDELDSAAQRRAEGAAALAMDHQELGRAPPDGAGVDAAGRGSTSS